MKKVFLSLLMALVCLPTVFAQVNVGHVIKIDSVTTCHDYVWERNNVTYTTDTVAMYSTADTTFILNFTKLMSFYDTANAIQIAGECKASWGGKSWTESGTFYDTLESVDGCDSIIRLEVVIASADANLVVEACGSYTAPWGEVYTESKEIDTLIVKPNCTYQSTISLTIHPTYEIDDVMVEAGCYYVWGDTVITDTDPHTRTLKTAEYQCDSVVTLTVTAFSGEQYDTVQVVACDKYKPAWTTEQTTSGYYSTDSLITVGGESCSKHYTIDLTIVESNNDTANTTPIDVTAGCSYIWNKDTITDTDVHYHLYESVIGGCDSLVAIKVAYTNKTYDTTHVEFCGKSYNWKNDNSKLPGNASKYVYTQDTIAKDSVTNDGCTTVYVLDLKFVNKHDTVYKYYCGDSYEHKFTRLTATGTQSATTKFDASGYYTVSSEGDTMYDVSSAGCKTVRTLNLELNIPEVRYRKDTTVAEACERYRFKADNLYGKWLTFTASCDSDVVHQQHSQNNKDQCYDSVAHLTLTIYSHTRQTTTARACDKYVWSVNDTIIGTFTETGTYRDTLDAPDTNGCLQIGTLNLTIFKTPVVDIEGKWMLAPGESTVLRAVPSADSDPINGGYKWFVDEQQVSNKDSVELTNVVKNTDVRLESVATHGSLKCVATNWITVTANLGIDEVEALHVNIYPNPASRMINIESDETIKEVVIYSANGQQVFMTEANSRIIQVNLENLVNGTYMMNIIDVNGMQSTRKLVVSK